MNIPNNWPISNIDKIDQEIKSAVQNKPIDIQLLSNLIQKRSYELMPQILRDILDEQKTNKRKF